MRELIVDNFAGGGGASEGIEIATRRNIDIAVNHDPAAIVMHKANHPDSEHYCESVWDINPIQATRNRPVGIAWFSPDCTHHSKARGGKPREKSIRGLAWVVVRWAITVRPRCIYLENVEEFKDWGPLLDNGTPDESQKGVTFKSFVKSLQSLGYAVEWRELRACDYGAPTSRKRLFLIARCDGLPIVWPEVTHGIDTPFRSAAEIIDWSIPCQSIFSRKRELVDKTKRRIARGIVKFLIEEDNPYILSEEQVRATNWLSDPPSDQSDIFGGYISSYYGETSSTEVRGSELDSPLHTITAGGNRFALVTTRLSKDFSKEQSHRVSAFLTTYYGASTGQDLRSPINTIVTKDRFGLVVVKGTPYHITDISMRMLSPRELYRGQGFPDDYIIDPIFNGKPLPKSEQVAKCGNSVSPLMAAAIIRANQPEMCNNSNYRLEAVV
ncbi:DNA cytosine methyltransferase [Paenibacillus sp. ACRRX]|uniref:DNA cytosine methyltransferase n=1 Tax=Paenibacillus sp. ACRRX TaxID=2918206 RepID=UPI001EF5C823|nr:DNA cytosine methyltransferase [Paenibacillus sp. ACRRX]MCG7407713.1 DNA cytosine methyltransferase [Paenibacillus sp. ACRRX]